MVVAITIGGISEALVLGTRLGVDPRTILDALSGGLAASRVMEVRRANFLGHAFTPGFRVDLHHKDLDIALASGGQANVPLPLTAGLQQLFRQLRAAGCGARRRGPYRGARRPRSAGRTRPVRPLPAQR